MSELTTQMAVKLSDENLSRLASVALVPEYDRAALRPGILHIGLGNFHRAHQAWYLHRLLQQGLAKDWAIVGAGVRPYDAQMREKLLAQDCLTTLIELDPSGQRVEITGSMIDYVPVEEGHQALIGRMSDPSIRIVSMTVTEGGYFQDVAGNLDVAHEDILHDAAHPETPRTAFGAIVAALRMRRAAGAPAFTALSCDNLQGNGAILKQTIVGLARLGDDSLADWIVANVSFPNSMVDCIVPATTPEVLASCRALGLEDAAPVTHESFRQWVVEDDFPAGRPPWEAVGATMTKDVHTYEAMKLRVLNGGHQLLANVGELLSVPTIADCMAHPSIRAFFRKVETEDIVPFVQPVPDVTPSEYLDLIDARFANPAIRDTTRRVAFDGSSRHVGFLLPSLRDGLDAGASIDGLALAEAFWARMCEGHREDGTLIEPNDPFWDALRQTAQEARTVPQVWLEQTQIYGNLGANERLSEAFARWLQIIWQQGADRALDIYLQDL